jgi:hypothetical protein
MKHILALGNSPVLTLLAVAAFLWLAHVSRHAENMKTLAEYGYTERSAAKYEPKPKKPYTAAQAKAIAEVYFLSENDLSRPVDLFMDGEKL